MFAPLSYSRARRMKFARGISEPSARSQLDPKLNSAALNNFADLARLRFKGSMTARRIKALDPTYP